MTFMKISVFFPTIPLKVEDSHAPFWVVCSFVEKISKQRGAARDERSEDLIQNGTCYKRCHCYCCEDDDDAGSATTSSTAAKPLLYSSD